MGEGIVVCFKSKQVLFGIVLNALLLPVGKSRNSELRSKFLDKPSKTSFVVLSLGKSKLKNEFFICFSARLFVTLQSVW